MEDYLSSYHSKNQLPFWEYFFSPSLKVHLTSAFIIWCCVVGAQVRAEETGLGINAV